MTLRGPDFLPYPMPARVSSSVATPPRVVDTRSRWDIAMANLTRWGVVAVTGGVVALLSLLLVSMLSGHRATGAVLAGLAAAVAVVAGVKALKRVMPPDSAHLIKSGQGTGVLSAVMAVLLLMLIRPAGAQPVQPPLPTVTQDQQSSPTPEASPSPSEGQSPGGKTLPQGVLPGFGRPTLPDPPLTEPATDKGTLAGLVIDTAGKPVAGATIVIERSVEGDTSDSPQCPVRSTTRTNAQGLYSLPLCQLGPDLGYQVTITAGGAVATTQLFVHSGRVTRYDVILATRTG